MGEIAVIDYGMGNLHSASKALERVAPEDRVIVTGDPGAILAADRVVFPGVGAMRDCMAEIRRLGIDTVVRNVLASGRPLLGICVGMQALLEFSEENDGVDCLGLIAGRVRFFGRDLRGGDGAPLKVPHMGWNQVRRAMDHPLWEGIDDGSRFYFVHSYYAEPADESAVAGWSEYGVPFAAAIAQHNLFAVQFHPEKSDRAGLRLLANFVRWDGRAD